MIDNAQKNKSKIAFIIWTPLHLFNALRFILSRELVGKCDAFYISQSSGMDIYYNNIIEEHIFNKTFYSNGKKIEKNQHIWEITSGLFCPTLYVNHMFGEGSTGNHYEKIFMSVPTRLNDAIIDANNCREVVGYDDGTGSYITNLYASSLGRKYEFAKKLRGGRNYSIDTSFLNSPENVITNNKGLKYKKINSKPLSNIDNLTIKRVFAYQQNKPYPKLVFLNQPFIDTGAKKDYRRIDQKVINVLRGKDYEAIIRIHPRENDKNIYMGLPIDYSINMWELICEYEITNDHILIGCFSTAQFSPKLLFNKEPWLVFAYDLYNGLFDQEQLYRMEEMIEQIRESYSYREKIITVKNIDELTHTIDRIRSIDY